MDVSSPSGFSVSEDANSVSDLMQSFSNHNQFLCESGVNIDNNVVAELGNALAGILHVQDVQELVSDHTSVPNEGKINWEDIDNSCEEWEEEQVSPSRIRTGKVLGKCATFPCTKKSLCNASVPGHNEISDIAVSGQCSVRYENRACSRSISLPTSSELVSALKGSRHKQGTPLTKLNVTWSPDVYDPPSTSLSHTVKGHSQQRSRTSRKNGKHKYKGKSSRGSNSDKKHYSSSDKKHYRRYSQNSERRSKSSVTNGIMNSEQSSKCTAIGDTRNSDLSSESPATEATKSELHLKAPTTYERFLQSDFLPSTVDLVMDFVTAQDSKCGNSFLRSSIGKVHISVAEAT